VLSDIGLFLPISGRRALFPPRVQTCPQLDCLRHASTDPPSTGPSHLSGRGRGNRFPLGYEQENTMRAKRLTMQQRRAVFQALVAVQDQGLMTVAESRVQVAKQFEITETQVRQIEEEGLENEWPPLDEAVQAAG